MLFAWLLQTSACSFSAIIFCICLLQKHETPQSAQVQTAPVGDKILHRKGCIVELQPFLFKHSNNNNNRKCYLQKKEKEMGKKGENENCNVLLLFSSFLSFQRQPNSTVVTETCQITTVYFSRL